MCQGVTTFKIRRQRKIGQKSGTDGTFPYFLFERLPQNRGTSRLSPGFSRESKAGTRYGVSHNTLQKIVKAESVRRNTLAKIVNRIRLYQNGS
jgi:hypothetical protein